MLVKDLIKNLMKMPQDATVVYAIDDEGNAFHEVYNDPTLGLFEEDEGFASDDQIQQDPDEYNYMRENGKTAVCIN